MKTVPLLRSATGLKDKLNAERAPFNVETGAASLTVATDVTLDLTGALSRRGGRTVLYSGKFHSLFSCGSYGLCVRDGILSVVNANLTITSVRSVGDGRMVYALVHDGLYDRVYYMNGVVSGIVSDGSYAAWDVLPYVGIQSTVQKVISYMPRVPVGHMVRVFNGIMYIAKDNVIYPSERYAYSWYDPQKAYTFRKRISMMRNVTTGLYVSDGTEVIFMMGHGPEDFARVPVCPYSVIEGSDINMPDQDSLRFALSGRGICTVDNAGAIVNLTETFLNFPEAGIGACHITKDKQYILTVA